MANAVVGQGGELRATVHIKRKDTGLTDTVQLVGHTDPEKLAEILARENVKPVVPNLSSKE